MGIRQWVFLRNWFLGLALGSIAGSVLWLMGVRW